MAAHCWQQYIDFWPVVKGFTVGSDQTSKKDAKKSGEKVVGKKITVNLVLIGENEFNNNFVTIKNLSSSEQYEIKSSNIINFLNDQIR